VRIGQRSTSRELPAEPSGFEIASLRGQIPVEHLQAALTALEPQLKREHAYRMRHLDKQELLVAARRKHAIHMAGIVAGFALAVAMLVSAVLLGISGQPWLAALLSGPSILALIQVFVLQKSDPGAMKASAAASKAATQKLVP
jgi:hypothetical protein